MAGLVIVVLAGLLVLDVAVEQFKRRTKPTEQQDRQRMLRAIERIERTP